MGTRDSHSQAFTGYAVAVEAEDYEELATDPQSTTTDAGTVVSRPADDVIKLADRAATVAALSGANANGGPKSPFRCLRMAQAKPPGSV